MTNQVKNNYNIILKQYFYICLQVSDTFNIKAGIKVLYLYLTFKRLQIL